MNSRHEESSIYWLSFLVRCCLGLLAWWASQYTNLSLVDDASMYESMGARIAQEWLAAGTSPTLEVMMQGGHQAWIMVWVLAVFSYLFKGARILPLIIVLYTLITAWTPVFTYRIALQLGISQSGAMVATRLIIFSPVFAFWSGALYKEGLVLLVLNILAYHVLLLQESPLARSIVVTAACLGILLGLRFYLAVILPPGIAIGLLLGRRRKDLHEPTDPAPGVVMLRQVLVATVLTAVLAVTGFNLGVRNILPDDPDHFLSLVQASRNDLASTNSGYLLGADVSTAGAALRFLPTGAAYFLTTPLPWQFGSIRQNLVLPEMIVWLFLYPFIFAGMKSGLRRNLQGSIFLISLTLAMLFLYGLFIGNAGTAYRLRAQVWLFWAIFLGWNRDEKRLRDQSEPFQTSY
jgi:hypothetical protein